jgi:hypothetical protein
MSVGAPSNLDKFRSSPLGQRIGSGIMSVFVLAYLALITYWVSDRLNSARSIGLLVFLWCIGIAALVLLSRPWRNPFRSNQIQSDEET